MLNDGIVGSFTHTMYSSEFVIAQVIPHIRGTGAPTFVLRKGDPCVFEVSPVVPSPAVGSFKVSGLNGSASVFVGASFYYFGDDGVYLIRLAVLGVRCLFPGVRVIYFGLGPILYVVLWCSWGQGV